MVRNNEGEVVLAGGLGRDWAVWRLAKLRLDFLVDLLHAFEYGLENLVVEVDCLSLIHMPDTKKSSYAFVAFLADDILNLAESFSFIS